VIGANELATGAFVRPSARTTVDMWWKGKRLEKATYTLALNDPSTCTSAIFVVPKNCSVGLPRILSSANANGFSSRSNLDFPLGVDVTVRFPRSPGAESRARVKLRPSRTMYESGSSSAPRYSSRWLVAIDVDAFPASVNIVRIHEWSRGKAKKVGVASECLAWGGLTVWEGLSVITEEQSFAWRAISEECLTRSHDRVVLSQQRSKFEWCYGNKFYRIGHT